LEEAGLEQKLSFINPRDPSNPANKRQEKVEKFQRHNPVLEMQSEWIASAGLDPAALLAKAIGNSESAAKELAQNLSDGTSPAEAEELITGCVQTVLTDAAWLLEEKRMVQKGDGVKAIAHAMSFTDEKIGKRLLLGLIHGDKATYHEIVRRFVMNETH
jgi:hypothetical protein